MAGIEHVVVVMMENRSFDEYFGTFLGVAGYYDGSPSIAQPWPDPAQVLYPFRMSTFTTNALASPGLGHDWVTNHVAINADPETGIPDNRGFHESSGSNADVMGCYVADDIPYHWALAQNFALCYHYFCSGLAGTYPNRMYLVGGTIVYPNQAPPASGIYPGNEPAGAVQKAVTGRLRLALVQFLARCYCRRPERGSKPGCCALGGPGGIAGRVIS